MSNKRASIILNYLKQENSVKFRDICDLFPEYNEMTIRRDLILLEKNGYITRSHGRVQICPDSMAESFYYSNRSVSALEEKRLIAIKASLLLNENSSIYLDASTTNLEFVKIMPDIPLFIITNDPLICFELSKKRNVEVMITGGLLNKSVVSVSGPVSIESLSNVNIDMAFIGAAGFTIENGFSNAHSSECELKRHIISMAKKVIMMIDSSKVGKVRQFTFAQISDIDMIICNKPLEKSISDKLKRHKVVFK